jgi:hypothetical protein
MNKIISIMLIFFFINGLFVVAVNTVSASASVDDSWSTRTPMSHARANLGIAVVDGEIYVIGDSSGWSLTNNECDNERYDPKTDTWTTLAPIPTPRPQLAVAACQGKIYCISVELFGGTEVYDIATNSWSKKVSIPQSIRSDGTL